MTRLYLAGYFDTRARLLPWRDALRAQGYEVTSRWLDESKDVTYATVDEAYRLACALRDCDDVRHAEALIVDTFDVSERGGREFEAGLAYALGIPLFIVGPFRNVFHRLALRHFEDWEACLRFFRLLRDLSA